MPQTLNSEIRKKMAKDYFVHIRSDPKDTDYARMIKEYKVSCKQKELYEKIAILEAYLTLKNLSWNSWTVYIGNKSFETSDEYSRLPNEEREKINKFLSSKLKMNKSDLGKLVEQNFKGQGWINYIG